MRLIDCVELREDGLYWKHQISKSCKVGQRVGCINTEGYRVFGFKGRQYKEHREVFFIVHGYYPDIIDHENKDRSDNRPSNLRDATPNQNQYNRSGIRGYRKKNNKYEARISFNGRRMALGTYNCPTTARLVYMKAAKELYGEWNEHYWI